MVASHGIPRLINDLCFNALSLCCEQKRQQVDGSMAAEAIAIQELDPESRKKITARWEPPLDNRFNPGNRSNLNNCFDRNNQFSVNNRFNRNNRLKLKNQSRF